MRLEKGYLKIALRASIKILNCVVHSFLIYLYQRISNKFRVLNYLLSIFTKRFYTHGVIIGQEAKYTYSKLLSHVRTNHGTIILLGVLFEKYLRKHKYVLTPIFCFETNVRTCKCWEKYIDISILPKRLNKRIVRYIIV